MTELRNYHRSLTRRRWKGRRSQHSLYCEQEGITVPNLSANFFKEITLGSLHLQLDRSSGGEDSEHDEEDDADTEGNAESTGSLETKDTADRQKRPAKNAVEASLK